MHAHSLLARGAVPFPCMHMWLTASYQHESCILKNTGGTLMLTVSAPGAGILAGLRRFRDRFTARRRKQAEDRHAAEAEAENPGLHLDTDLPLDR